MTDQDTRLLQGRVKKDRVKWDDATQGDKTTQGGDAHRFKDTENDSGDRTWK